MVYLVTWRFEKVLYNDKQVDTIANLVEKNWLYRYPRPTIIMHDRGNEFLGHAFINDEVKNEYGIKSKFATTETTQLHSIL